MHGLAVIDQRRHCLSMVIWRRDAFVTYLRHGMWPTQEPPCRFQITCFQTFRFARSSQSVNLFRLALDMAMVPFQFFSGLFADPFLSGVIGVFFARKMHSTSKFAMTVLSKCKSFCMCFFAVCLCRSLKFCVYLCLLLLRISHSSSISFLLIICINFNEAFTYNVTNKRVTCSSTFFALMSLKMSLCKSFFV